MNVLTHKSQDHGGRHVGNEDDAEAVDDGQWDGSLWVVRLLACGRDDVEPNEGVEAGRRSTEHLDDNETNEKNFCFTQFFIATSIVLEAG